MHRIWLGLFGIALSGMVACGGGDKGTITGFVSECKACPDKACIEALDTKIDAFMDTMKTKYKKKSDAPADLLAAADELKTCLREQKNKFLGDEDVTTLKTLLSDCQVCTDKACADKVQDSLMTLGKGMMTKYGNVGEAPPALVTAGEEIAKCLTALAAKLAETAPVPVPTPDAPVPAPDAPAPTPDPATP